MQALNERRSEATEVTPEAFDVLLETLRVFLDGCRPWTPDGDASSAAVSAESSLTSSPVGAFVGPAARKHWDDEVRWNTVIV